MDEISGYLGKLGLPAAMTLLLGIIYKFVPENFPDKFKTLLVISFGIILSAVWTIYIGKAITFISGVDCFFYGIQLGATSIGFFKVGQAVGIFTPPKT